MKILVQDQNSMLLWVSVVLILKSLMVLSKTIRGFDCNLPKVSIT